MNSTRSNGIGKKVQMAVAGAVIAGSLLVALPMAAGAQVATCPQDYTGPLGQPDGAVTIADVSFVLMHYRQDKLDGAGVRHGPGVFLIGDVSEVLAAYHQPC